jgi:WD40 repeat protein
MIQAFTGHTGAVLAAAFSPDGKRVLTSSDDQTIRLWDTQTGAELRRFSGNAGVMWHIAITPDGQRLLAGGVDPTARLWDLDSQATIASICARLPRDFTADERVQYEITDNQPTCPPPSLQAAPTGTSLPAR